VNNDRLIAILFAMLIVVGAWRAYDYLARPASGDLAADPESVLEPSSAREDLPAIRSTPDEPAAAGQSGSGEGAEAPQRIFRCRVDGEIVLTAEPCAPGTEAGEATPVLGRERSERPSRADAPRAARDRPESVCERIDRQLDKMDTDAQQRAGEESEEVSARRSKLVQERVSRGCGPRTSQP
jgi:hypothetical protein